MYVCMYAQYYNGARIIHHVLCALVIFQVDRSERETYLMAYLVGIKLFVRVY